MENKKITRLAMLLALSLVLGIVESLFPILGGMIPGMKLGLANIITVLTLYLFGFKEALCISILRVFLMGILRTGLFSTTFFFSLSGALFSAFTMAIFKKTKLSIIGVSVIGAIFHTIGQIVTAIFLLQVPSFIYYLPFMLLFAVITGTFVGILSNQLYIHLQKRL